MRVTVMVAALVLVGEKLLGVVGVVVVDRGLSTDMGGGLSRGQGEAAAVTVVTAAASFGQMSLMWVSSVSMSTRCQV